MIGYANGAGDMSALPPSFSLLLLLGAVSSIAWIAAEVGRKASVKGSHRRYVLASTERGFRYPAIVYLIMSAATESVYGTWLQFLFDCVGIALWIWLWWEKQRDGEDDDFWNGLSGRMRRSLGGSIRSLATGGAR
ncbi:hypothetical protein GCM10027273_12210 [Nocardioides pakistanensis]